MKIVLVGLTYPFRGGIAHYTTLLYRALVAGGHEVEFLALSRQYPGFLFPGRTQTDESLQPLAVPNRACLDSIDPLSWFATYARARRARPQVAIFSWWHPFFAPAFGTVALLLATARVQSLFICHNVLPHERSRVDRVLAAYAYAAPVAFITHSEADAALMRRLKPRARVAVNPHPSYEELAGATAPDQAHARARLGLEGRRVLLFFGFIREYKGLADLLAAVESLPDSGGYHLLVVGENYEGPGKYAAAMERLAARGRITHIDRYVPNEEIPLYFAAADVVMVPYTSATASGIIQIAYGLGRPVIATRTGGLPEAVREGATGYLVAPGAPAELAAAIERFYRERGAIDFAGAIAAEAERFSWRRMVTTIEGLVQ